MMDQRPYSCPEVTAATSFSSAVSAHSASSDTLANGGMIKVGVLVGSQWGIPTAFSSWSFPDL